MADIHIGQVQACLREAATINYDAMDEMLFEMTGIVASVRVNTQLWLVEMYGFSATFH